MAACVSAAVGAMGRRSSMPSSCKSDRRRSVKVACSSSSTVMDPYRTLRIEQGATESEVKKAFRRLALQYHPDVCRGSNCGVEFRAINEAYDVVMSRFRGEEMEEEVYEEGELWEEWMGWEGAGIRDYSSHINPYI